MDKTEALALMPPLERLLQSIGKPSEKSDSSAIGTWEAEEVAPQHERGKLMAIKVEPQALTQLAEEFTPAHVASIPSAWAMLLIDLFGHGTLPAEMPANFKQMFTLI